MGKKLKKKAPEKKKRNQRNSDSRRDNWPLGGSKYSDSESPQIEDKQAKEVSGTNFWSSGDSFLYSCNAEDIESDSERNIEATVKRLTNKIREQQDLFEKRKCTYKKEITRLKSQLEDGNKIKKKYKEKEDQSQRL